MLVNLIKGLQFSSLGWLHVTFLIIYPVRNNASLLYSGVRFYNNSGGV